MKISTSRTIELHEMSVRTEITVEDCELPTHSVTLAAMLDFLKRSEAQNAVTATPHLSPMEEMQADVLAVEGGFDEKKKAS